MSPYPLTSVPTLPTTGECCFWQLHKKAEGQREVRFDSDFKCDTGATVHGNLAVTLKLFSAGLPCDQQAEIIPEGSVLRATGTVYRRDDGMADFTGRFTIANPNRQILFRGAIELMDRIGTHHSPFGSEPCNPESHVEGWLVGLGSTLLPNHAVRALFVARGSIPAGGGAAPLTGSLDGLLTKAP